jgi:hypothetical protein
VNGRELAKVLGVSEKQIYHWSKRKWLLPTRHDAGRWTGEELWFPEEEQEVARRMVGLVRAGMYPDAATKVARGAPGALSKLLAAVGPCVGTGELRYRLPQGGPERTHWGAGPTAGGSGLRAPCTKPPLPDCLGDEPCG